jgi:glucose/arabinose dehydrogenase
MPSFMHRFRELGGGAALTVAVLLGLTAVAGAQGLPLRFVEEPAFSRLNEPTAVRFHPDGRVFVAEKRGIVRVYDSLDDATPTTFVDIRGRVHSYWDRGLLGLALHPDFAAHPYVYVLYTLDARPGQTPPSWGDDCPDPPGGTADGCVVQARLSRFRAAGNVADGAEVVLIQDWCQQYPSHSIGALQFGADGALYVSAGEGADFNLVDYGQRGEPLNPCADPPVATGVVQQAPGAEGGALRAQDLRTTGDPLGLGGTLLRVDPLTGEGLPGNPLQGGADASDDRVIAFGLRNPFRFALRPGTREVWIGDVGWNAWEEIDVIADATDATVENFGWPCYEGAAKQSGYDAADLTLCETLYAAPAQHTPPFHAYHHGDEVVVGDGCGTGSSSVSALAFYDGASFPSEYGGALFFADYARNCIWAMMPDANGRPDPDNRRVFRTAADGPIDLRVGPGGDLYYVAVRSDSIRRIRYSNDAPFAQVTASAVAGPVPLRVQFDASASSDPNGDTLGYAWDLDGDGAFDDSTAVAPAHTFVTDGSFTVRVRVTDPIGLFDDASVIIDANNTPPVATVDTPLPLMLWRVGDTIAFSGHADDAEEGVLPADALAWEIVLQHCDALAHCHEHVTTAVSGIASGTFAAPDHPYPSFLEVRLTATDSLGLTDTFSIAIEPETAVLELTSEPAAFSLALDGEVQSSPISVQAIVGSVHSVSAQSPQIFGGESYELAAWSDEGAATHLVTLAPGGTQLHAVFEPSSVDGGAAGDGGAGNDGAVPTDDAGGGPDDGGVADGGVSTDGGAGVGGAGVGGAGVGGAGVGGGSHGLDASASAGTHADASTGHDGAAGVSADSGTFEDAGAAGANGGSSGRDGCDCTVPGSPVRGGSAAGLLLVAALCCALRWRRRR